MAPRDVDSGECSRILVQEVVVSLGEDMSCEMTCAAMMAGPLVRLLCTDLAITCVSRCKPRGNEAVVQFRTLDMVRRTGPCLPWPSNVYLDWVLPVRRL